MLKRLKWIIIFLLIILANKNAYATFALVGDALYTIPEARWNGSSYRYTLNVNEAKLGYGMGFLFESRISKKRGFEIGVLLLDRISVMEQKGDNNEVVYLYSKFKSIYVPVVIRWWIFRNFSIGIGGFYTAGFGNEVTYNFKLVKLGQRTLSLRLKQ